MIEESEIIGLQLQAAYGAMLPDLIKSLVNRELDAGIWLDGYELAVTPNELNLDESNELLKIILTANPQYKINIEALSGIIEHELPQGSFARLTWLVAEDATFVISDSLRVARFRYSDMIWCTPRISYDGIKLKEIKNNEVHGLCWHLSKSYDPDEPFCLDLKNGTILIGTIIE